MSNEALVGALTALYAHVYAVPAEEVRHAAQLRAEATRLSDAWIEGQREATSPLVEAERVALVRSYAALLAAVHR